VKGARGAEWLPTALAALAFVGFVLAFLYELFSYREAALAWASRDVNSRAHLAAANLREPLRTQDFVEVQRIGASCEADGVHLFVTSPQGGVVYDSRPRDKRGPSLRSERCQSGEYSVAVGLPQERVLAPFRRALRGFLLAGLVGIAGVLLFFFVTYRQRVRIRELKRVEMFRRTFVADVSHEIKTPLAGILGAVDLLDAADAAAGDEERREVLLGMIRRESRRLNGLVQQILDLARLEREDESLNRTETDLVALAADVAAREGVKFVADGASSSCVCSCDPQLIEQALLNLIENAKRHSGSSDIAVFVEGDAKSCRIRVEDHGIGVPPEHAERIFERFHRVDPARAAETGGAGLGLAIVRRIARLHGGDVTCSPAIPHGCVFTLVLSPTE